MKHNFFTFFYGLLICIQSPNLWAQKTSVTEIPMNENTTISIKKGDAAAKSEKLYEIVEGSSQIEGEPTLMSKGARASWKKACDEWKKEIRNDNKDSKVMITDCGKAQCAPQGNEGSVCHSEGIYKIKTKVN